MSNAAFNHVAVFDTRPDSSIETESPLAWARHRGVIPPSGKAGRVTLVERACLGHLILRGGAIVLDEAVREVLGINLPGKPLGLSHDSSGKCSIQWLSPDEWLIIVPGGEEFELENRLRDQLGDAHFAIANVSGGQTLLELSGEGARELLMKSIPYDVHPDHFPVGKAVSTVFAKASAILRHPTQEHFELVVRRSFADYCLRWLLDAGEEYGISVEQ